MRRAFDQSFTRPPPVRAEVVDLLAVTVGADSLAIRMDTVSGLLIDRAVTFLPGSPPALLGVAGLRGHLIPVYDLAAILGAAGGPPAGGTGAGLAGGAGGAAAWCLILLAGSPAVAVAVDRLDAHLRVPHDAITEPASGDPNDPNSPNDPNGPMAPAVTGGIRVPAVVRTADGPRPVVDVAAVRAAIAKLNEDAIAKLNKEEIGHATEHHV
jgi:purine-binding chemotaxis protein CheW